MTQIAAEILSVPLADVVISETATNTAANTLSTAASASSDLNGYAIFNACTELNTRLAPYKENLCKDATMKQLAHAAQFDRTNLSAPGFYKTPDIGYVWGANTGLIHRYPGRAFFLGKRYCAHPESLFTELLKLLLFALCIVGFARAPMLLERIPNLSRRSSRGKAASDGKMFAYIESRPNLKDIVLSGGDAYYLQPEHLLEIRNRYCTSETAIMTSMLTSSRLLDMPNIRRIRIVSKGLSVAPCRIKPGEPWIEALINVAKKGRSMGK